jgi:hypothetical protein
MRLLACLYPGDWLLSAFSPFRNLPCFNAIKGHGGQDALDKHYGEWKAEAEVGYDISLHIKISGPDH